MQSLSIKTKQLFKIIRYPNLLIMIATQLLCAYWLTPSETEVWQSTALWFTVLATVLIAGAGYIINDIFDFKADVINKPDKVIITSQNRSQYGLLYYGANALGILSGLIASVYVGLVCVVITVLLYYYSYKLKKIVLWGNITVALISASVLLIVQIPFPSIHILALYVFSAFAFLTTLVRELTKDIEDIEGDKTVNYNTLPIVLGVHNAKRAAITVAVVLLLCIVVFAIWCLLHLKIWAFYYLTIMTAIPAIGLILLLNWAKEKKHYSQASLLSKLIMLSGVISMYFIL